MKITSIKKGKWYRTTHGNGRCVSVGGNFPPSVMVDITSPFPRGRVNLKPRDVLEEIEAPTASTEPPG